MTSPTLQAPQEGLREIQNGIETRKTKREIAIEQASTRKAQRVANFVLKSLKKGLTDVPAKSRSGPSFFHPNLYVEDAEKLITDLAEKGVSADVYPKYKGLEEWEFRVAVTKVGDKRIQPSPDYQRALELKASMATMQAKEARKKAKKYARGALEASTEPLFVPQTDKYVRKVGPREYVTTDEPHGVVNFQKYASDEGYAEALSSKVIQCVDIVIHDPRRDTILLGTRQQEPHAGDWVIGGGMRAGESVTDAAHRNMERELHVSIDDSLLTRVGDYKFIWDSRAQEPTLDEAGQEIKGCHMSSTLVEYPMSEEDLDLDSFNEEYSNVAWVPVSEILSAAPGVYHPCLVDMVSDMRAK